MDSDLQPLLQRPVNSMLLSEAIPCSQATAGGAMSCQLVSCGIGCLMPDVPMILSIGPLPCQAESSEEAVRRLFRNDIILGIHDPQHQCPPRAIAAIIRFRTVIMGYPRSCTISKATLPALTRNIQLFFSKDTLGSCIRSSFPVNPETHHSGTHQNPGQWCVDFRP